MSLKASGESIAGFLSLFSTFVVTFHRNLEKDPNQAADVPFKNYFFTVLCIIFTEAMILFLTIHLQSGIVLFVSLIVICLVFVLLVAASCVKALQMSKDPSFSQNASFKQLKER
jgi:uncharacterized membrane protein